ncbi:hypothetical protein GCM10023339_38310 [Alloalcanivorax gelatiniphagus]
MKNINTNRIINNKMPITAKRLYLDTAYVNYLKIYYVMLSKFYSIVNNLNCLNRKVKLQDKELAIYANKLQKNFMSNLTKLCVPGLVSG